MATTRRNLQSKPRICDIENTGHVLAKNVLKKPAARPALGEIKQISNRETFKKPVAAKVCSFRKPMVRPAAKVVKAVAKPVVVPKVEVPKVLKREESIVKHELVRAKPKASVVDDFVRAQTLSYSAKLLEAEDAETDPQFVPEYINDIFQYMRKLEARFEIRELFLQENKTTPKMRAVLLNWLMDVHSNFQMLPETFHLTVAMIDRYLQRIRSVGKHNLQLVGITALFIASKYEEIHIPDIREFVYVCDDTYTKSQILQMELQILRALNFGLGRPLSIHFLRRYSKIAKVKPLHHTLAKYFLELALVQYELAHHRPSIIAAAATFLAIATVNDTTDNAKIWTRPLEYFSTYRYEEIEPVVRQLAGVAHKNDSVKLQSVRLKYAAKRHLNVSNLPELSGTVITKLAQK